MERRRGEMGSMVTERESGIMVESIRGFRLALTSLLWIGASVAASPFSTASAGQDAGAAPAPGETSGRAKAEAEEGGRTARDRDQDAPKPGSETPNGDARSHLSDLLSRLEMDPPGPFVPLRPRTVEEGRRIEAIRLYTGARSLEDQGRRAEAAAMLQEALKLDPESVAIPKRLSRLYVGPLRNPELAVQFGKKVLQAEPGDTDTLTHLVDFYTQKNDAAAVEALLKGVLANPKLEAKSPGRLLAEAELGRLYSIRPDRVQEAADRFATVIEMLDDKAAGRLSPQDLARILGNDPSNTYLAFGTIFLSAKRPELAVRAFERGLVYNEENPRIPLRLAETLLTLGKGERALELVDRYIKRQTQDLEAYDLLAKVLTALKREDEITPRLEEAARLDSKNVPLQYVLADRYREIGQVDKAEELYKKLLGTQPTLQTYGALAQSLLKRRKYDELLKVVGKATGQPQGFQAVRPQLELISADPAQAEAVLDAAYEILSKDFSALPRPVLDLVLPFLGNQGAGDKTRRLEKLLRIQLLLLDRSPTAKEYKEIFDTQQKLGKYADAVEMLEKMLAQYPAEKNLVVLLALAESQHRAGKDQAALASTREALKLAPGDFETQGLFAELLAQIGQVDEAVELLRKVVKNEPDNPEPELRLGGILTRFGRNEEAIKLFNDMLKRHANNELITRMAHQSLSIVYVNQGDYAKGESELEAILERSPDEAGVNNDLGYLFAEQGKNLDKAETMIRKALREEPENYAYLDSLGWVLFKQGKLKEALANLQKAVEKLDRPDPTILEHLGDVYLKLQDLSKAKDSWTKAKEAAASATPPDKRLDEIRKKLESLDKLTPTPRPESSKNP
jgi:tetratricopeptide (TPR) repeat protein